MREIVINIGILVKAKEQGLVRNLADCVSQMRVHGIWISDALIHQALAAVGESSVD